VLSRDDFITAARALLEKSGAEAVTTRALGQAMGVDPTSLYRHFASREDLLVAVLNAALEEAVDAIDLRSGTPRQRIERIARSARDVFGISGRTVMLAAVMTTAQPHGEGIMRLTLELFREMGVAEVDLAPSYQAFESLVLGMTAFDFTNAPDHSAQRARRYRATADPALEAIGAEPSLVEKNDAAAFELALGALLDAIEARATRRPRKSDSNPE